MKPKIEKIAMKCTQKEYDTIKDKLKINGILVKSVTSFKKYPYLINFDYQNTLSNISDDRKLWSFWDENPEIHENFNAQIFLKACGIDIEETVTVPKSLITELCKDKNVRDILVRNGVVVEDVLEIGKWYKNPDFGCALYCITKIENGYIFAYGFDFIGKWHNDSEFGKIQENDNPQPATESEVFEALKAECNKRNLVKPYNFNALTFDFGSNQLYADMAGGNFSKWIIFDNGKWAEPIEETYIKITLSEIKRTSNDAELGRTVRNIADKY